MSGPSYIASLTATFSMLHKCTARHVETVPVIERFKGKIIWEGEVEVFDLQGHPKATRGYAWSYSKDGTEHTTAVLELPPVISPQTAVRVAAANEIKNMAKK